MQLKAWEDLGLNSTASAAGERKFWMQLQGNESKPYEEKLTWIGARELNHRN